MVTNQIKRNKRRRLRKIHRRNKGRQVGGTTKEELLARVVAK